MGKILSEQELYDLWTETTAPDLAFQSFYEMFPETRMESALSGSPTADDMKARLINRNNWPATPYREYPQTFRH